MTAPVTRDLDRERAFLEAAAAPSGTPRFVEHAQARLEQGEREFGDRWTRMTLGSFLHELSEEAVDLGAWAALAEQSLVLDEFPELVRSHIAVALHEAAVAGARAHRIVETVGRVLQHSEGRTPS